MSVFGVCGVFEVFEFEVFGVFEEAGFWETGVDKADELARGGLFGVFLDFDVLALGGLVLGEEFWTCNPEI